MCIKHHVSCALDNNMYVGKTKQQQMIVSHHSQWSQCMCGLVLVGHWAEVLSVFEDVQLLLLIFFLLVFTVRCLNS